MYNMKNICANFVINDFEVIEDIIVEDIASTIKSLVNPKGIITIVKVNTL